MPHRLPITNGSDLPAALLLNPLQSEGGRRVRPFRTNELPQMDETCLAGRELVFQSFLTGEWYWFIHQG